MNLPNITSADFLPLLPAILLVLVMGLMPQPFLDRINPSTERFISRANLGIPGNQVQASEVQISVMGLPPTGLAAAPNAPTTGPLADRR